jgi:pSer/pThr/pTyr-binding forkhead associated (FHA) protein
MKQGDTYVNVRGGSNKSSNPYSRISEFDQNAGTYVPGMHAEAPGVKNENEEPTNDTPVVGFLYSISRKGIGEYWPLHLGSNTIGRATDCDVILNEMTVSEHHATISIKQMKSTHKLIASIRDIGSQNGIYLNEEELDYENHTCKSNDLITIGRCYKLLLLLVDTEQYGLSVAENFVPADGNISEPIGRITNEFNPYNSSDRNVVEGTIDLSGDKFGDPGSTKYI